MGVSSWEDPEAKIALQVLNRAPNGDWVLGPHVTRGKNATGPVALADVDDAGLQKTSREVAESTSEKKLHVTTHLVDVSDARRMEQFASEVVQQHERVTLLISNAGVALYGFFEEVTMADFEWLMGINFWGVVHGVRNFLPVLRHQPRAHKCKHDDDKRRPVRENESDDVTRLQSSAAHACRQLFSLIAHLLIRESERGRFRDYGRRRGSGIYE